MGWLVALGVLVILAALPLGVSVRYDEDGIMANALAGQIKIRLYPRRKRSKKPENKPREAQRKRRKKPKQPSRNSRLSLKAIPGRRKKREAA